MDLHCHAAPLLMCSADPVMYRHTVLTRQAVPCLLFGRAVQMCRAVLHVQLRLTRASSVHGARRGAHGKEAGSASRSAAMGR